MSDMWDTRRRKEYETFRRGDRWITRETDPILDLCKGASILAGIFFVLWFLLSNAHWVLGGAGVCLGIYITYIAYKNSNSSGNAALIGISMIPILAFLGFWGGGFVANMTNEHMENATTKTEQIPSSDLNTITRTEQNPEAIGSTSIQPQEFESESTYSNTEPENPCEIWANNFPQAAQKLKPGDSCYQ